MTREVFRLSQQDRELLMKHYDFYAKLASGARQPSGDAQTHFVAVCAGRAEPITEHEQAYMNFRKLVLLSKLTERQVVDYHFAVEVPIGKLPQEARQPVQSSATSYREEVDWDDIDEFGEGIPRPGWFTDDGWKRVRSGYRSDSRDY